MVGSTFVSSLVFGMVGKTVDMLRPHALGASDGSIPGWIIGGILGGAVGWGILAEYSA